jgi:hypothetical protein
MVIWYIFSPFGMVYQENLATLLEPFLSPWTLTIQLILTENVTFTFLACKKATLRQKSFALIDDARQYYLKICANRQCFNFFIIWRQNVHDAVNIFY